MAPWPLKNDGLAKAHLYAAHRLVPSRRDCYLTITLTLTLTLALTLTPQPNPSPLAPHPSALTPHP